MGRRDRKKEQRKQLILSIVLVSLMVLSVFGIIIGSQTSDLRYGKQKFEYMNNYYVTKINNQQMHFYFLPVQVEYINVSSDIINKLKESYLIMIAFNPEEKANLQVIELVRFDLSNQLNKALYQGVLTPDEDYESLPLLSCSNATINTPLIIMNVSDDLSITQQDNCIYLNARGTDFLRLRDRLLYSYYGVIKDG